MLFAESISKAYGSRDILRGVSFVIGDRDRVGLVGQNGTGKSTLLRILAGDDAPDAGRAWVNQGSLGFLRQEAGLDSDRRLIDELWAAFPEAVAIEQKIHAISDRISAGDGDLDALIGEQGHLFEAFEAIDGYRIEARIGRVLAGLGFAERDREKPSGAFSGGWQMRVALAKILVHRPDHLLLDEPTNHLDTGAQEWLAEELRTYPGAVLLVTHDHAFMDQLVDRVLEIEGGAVTAYAGNYSAFVKQKSDRQSQLDRAADRQGREIERQERFIERFRAKATKATLVKSREKALARIDRIERPRETASARFSLQSSGRSALEVLLIQHLSHAYDDHPVLLDVSLDIERGDKVVLVGPNGGGKSTLLKLIAGSLQPTEGTIRWGENARFAYYDQHQDEALDPNATVLESVRSYGGNAPDVRLRAALGQFLFHGDDVFKPVAVLSGGERSRVALARLLVQPANVLVLDEPTNHLDRATRRQLVDALRKYDGTVICASHDQEIVERVATRRIDVRDANVSEPGKNGVKLT